MHEAACRRIGPFLVLALLAFGPSGAWALDTTLRVHGGYNSNSEARAHGPSSGFGQLDVHLSQPGDLDRFDLGYEGIIDASYLKDTEGEYRATVGGTVDWSPEEDRLSPGLMYAYSIYRGEEDVNTHAVTLWADWSLNDRAALGIEQALSWEDYRGEVTLNAGGAPTYRLGSIHGPALQSWGTSAGIAQNLSSIYDWVTTSFLSSDPGWLVTRSALKPVTVKREDSFSSTTLRYARAVGEGLRLDLSLARDHLDSNIDAAVYRRNTIGLKGAWQFAPRWELVPQARWSATRYKIKHPIDDDPDMTTLVSLGLIRLEDAYSVSWRIEHLDNDSPFEEECYERTVVECIFAYRF
ncbi:MAG TPA: hypothetical protein PLB81_05100 [Deltaproteobacteria bacterium]|nr:hypothetical protein [Deltaproteobacteria bacterium]